MMKIKEQQTDKMKINEQSSVERGGTQNDRQKRSKFHNLKILGY